MPDPTLEPPTGEAAEPPIDPLLERAMRRSSAARHERNGGPATPPSRDSTASPSHPNRVGASRRASTAPAGRMIAAGAALGGSFLAVGAMAAATQPDPTPAPPAQPTTIRRVVVADTPANTASASDPIVIRVELPRLPGDGPESVPASAIDEAPSPAATAPPVSAPPTTTPPPAPPPEPAPAPAPAPITTESEGS